MTDSYWRTRIPWYPPGCFGPYRSKYTRRELAADAAVHAVGCLGGLVAAARLVARTCLSDGDEAAPAPLVAGVVVYAASLLAMLGFSALFNMTVRNYAHKRWELQLLDHTGILLLIAGTYTPFMMRACSPKTLGFVWAVGATSFLAKASKSPLDTEALHVLCFLAMGWACVGIFDTVVEVASPWAVRRIILGGCLYTGGLVPWAWNGLEFHNAIWHVFVLAGSLAFFSVVWYELSLPPPPGNCPAIFG